MYRRHCPPTWILHLFKCFIHSSAIAVLQATDASKGTQVPFTSGKCWQIRNGNNTLPWSSEYSEEIMGSIIQLFVGDLSRNQLERVYPTVTDSIRKLFLLPPCHFVRKVVLKSFSENVFFDLPLLAILSFGLILMATSINSLSRNGNLPSTPQAANDLLALRQS